MKISENAINVAALSKIKGIGNAWIAENFTVNLSEEEIIERIKQKNKTFSEEDFYDYQDKAKKELEALRDSIDGVIAFCDKEFPQYNVKIEKDSDKPVLLTYKGDLKLLAKQNLLRIAVIGLLNPDEKIKKFEEKILDKILEKDAVIVSGLANGCDQIAHEYTLKKDGATIAILPSTLQKILPASNAELAQEIVAKGGLLISEYVAECENPKFELAKRYIDRDRLQALFSNAVCLIASYSEEDRKKDSNKDAGSRHALGKAKEWGITRLAPKGLDGDERFNLNREILSNGAVEINSQNLESELDKIIKAKSQESKLPCEKTIPKESAESNLFGNLVG